MTSESNDLAPRNTPPRVLAISSSPRRDGNSRLLAEALLEGAAEAGSAVELVHLADHVEGHLRDCTQCRKSDGTCAIDDGYAELFLDKVLPADAIVYATPIWWYGISGPLKTFIDRFYCYVSSPHPGAAENARRLLGKRAALLMTAEESSFSVRLGIVQQMQELCRYLDHSLVGMVTGIGNKRGEVRDDPSNPLESARQLGRNLFKIQATDYRLTLVRSKVVWEGEERPYPGYWR